LKLASAFPEMSPRIERFDIEVDELCFRVGFVDLDVDAPNNESLFPRFAGDLSAIMTLLGPFAFPVSALDGDSWGIMLDLRLPFSLRKGPMLDLRLPFAAFPEAARDTEPFLGLERSRCRETCVRSPLLLESSGTMSWLTLMSARG
jgi:hypothetical protein